jgi:thiamine biosynthesis lipoprotein
MRTLNLHMFLSGYVGTLKIIRFTFLICLIALSWFVFSTLACRPQEERIFRKSMLMMDTLVTITAVSATEADADKAIDMAFQEIGRLEKAANFYSHESEISHINTHAGISPVKVSADIIDLLSKARDVAEVTDGAFDPTIGPLISLYDFRNHRAPSDQEVRKNLRLVNYRNMVIDREESRVFLEKKGMLIDPGGIMKGYAAGKAAEVLRQHGIYSGIVAVAGDIRAFGVNPDGKPWRIGIRDPRGKKDDDIVAVIELGDMSVSTSGDYERYFIQNGKRIHHLISPKTGYPAESCRSVSIISPEGAFADAYSTGICILGPEKGLKVIEKAGLDGIIIDERGILHTSHGIREHLELQKHP